MDELNKINLDDTSGSMPKEAIPVTGDSAMTDQEPGMTITHKKTKSGKGLVLFVVIGLIAGSATGFYMAKSHMTSAAGAGSGATTLQQNPTTQSSIHVGDTFGSNDTATFKDQTEGVLQLGGIGGEGSHHLVRGANASQWVYLTSSVVDLDMFVGDDITVWGQTQQGKKAGWLMDVGKVKVVQLNAATPTPSAKAVNQPQD